MFLSWTLLCLNFYKPHEGSSKSLNHWYNKTETFDHHNPTDSAVHFMEQKHQTKDFICLKPLRPVCFTSSSHYLFIIISSFVLVPVLVLVVSFFCTYFYFDYSVGFMVALINNMWLVGCALNFIVIHVLHWHSLFFWIFYLICLCLSNAKVIVLMSFFCLFSFWEHISNYAYDISWGSNAM